MGRPNWLNENRFRAFPFVDTTAGVNVPESGPVTLRQLPDDWIADCGFVIGPQAGYDPAEHDVYLKSISRSGVSVVFQFGCDAPGLYGHPLSFTRTISDEDYATEHVDGDLPPEDSQSYSNNPDDPSVCTEPLWYGYLTTGRMSSVAERLGDGDSLSREDGDCIVEPALIQDLTAGYVSSVSLANDDRTRITGAGSCEDPSWPYATGGLFVSARCLRGELPWLPGYNCVILQDTTANGLVFQAVVNAGKGEPCGEVPLFDDEVPPTGSSNSLLAGGVLCNETIRSINGVGGPLLEILAGNGVTVTPDPENHRIVVDVDLNDLSNCFGTSQSEDA